MIKKIISILANLVIFSNILAQTAGIGTLTTIESKANQIDQNYTRLGELNRKHLQSYELESQKLNDLKNQLKKLIKEKELVLDDFRNGYFCGGCDKPRSQFGPGEQFPHEGQKVIPASPEKIKAKEKEFDDKIQNLIQSIKEFESSENEFTRMRMDLDKQMNKLKEICDDLRNEIIELSKKYKDIVANESKKVTLNLIEPLLSILATKHYIEDRINILIVKIEDLKKEKTEKIKIARENAAKQVEERKMELQQKIKSKQFQIEQLEKAHIQRLNPNNNKLSEISEKLIELKKAINSKGQTIQNIQKYTEEYEKMENLYSETEKIISDYVFEYNTQKNTILSEIKELSDKIWFQYTVNYSKILDSAESVVNDIYILRNKVLLDAKSAREFNLQTSGQQLLAETNSQKNKLREYATTVEDERIRLMRACSKAGCSCFGTDISGNLNGLWSLRLGCLGNMDLRHAGSAYYGCEEEEAIYLRYYNSSINGLSDTDLEALKRKMGDDRFNSLIKKIN